MWIDIAVLFAGAVCGVIGCLFKLRHDSGRLKPLGWGLIIVVAGSFILSSISAIQGNQYQQQANEARDDIHRSLNPLEEIMIEVEYVFEETSPVLQALSNNKITSRRGVTNLSNEIYCTIGFEKDVTRLDRIGIDPTVSLAFSSSLIKVKPDQAEELDNNAVPSVPVQEKPGGPVYYTVVHTAPTGTRRISDDSIRATTDIPGSYLFVSYLLSEKSSKRDFEIESIILRVNNSIYRIDGNDVEWRKTPNAHFFIVQVPLETD